MTPSRKILVTGGAGFIGSNFIRLLIKSKPDWHVVNLDKLTYAGNLVNLSDIENHPNYSFIKGDITSVSDVKKAFDNEYDYLVNFAAETHVDRSLYDPHTFIRTNVLGTQVLLDNALKSGISKFIQISTDEVYGSIEPPNFADEDYPLSPSSPYSSSKASADLLALSYYKTHDMPVVITRTCNNYGPYQFPEKVIPFFVSKALKGENLPVYGDGSNIRDWIYVEDNCNAILKVLESGADGEIYNISGESMVTNLELTKAILNELGKSEDLISFVKDRPGHDLRYAIKSSKMNRNIGWKPEISFSDGLKKTVNWYKENSTWCEEVISKDNNEFFYKHYKDRK